MSRAILGVAGLAIGSYTIYGVVLAVGQGTNLAWTIVFGALMLVLSALLVHAAIEKPAHPVPRRVEAGRLTAGAVVGGAVGYAIGGEVGAVVIGLLAVLVAALASITLPPIRPVKRHEPRDPNPGDE